MKITRVITALMLALLMLGAVACGTTPAATATPPADGQSNATSDDQAATDLYDTIISRGKLILGTEAYYEPYEFHAIIDGVDTIAGMDIDIAREIAADMGVELEIRDLEFDALIPAVQLGSVDISLAGINPDDDRRMIVDFSNIYYEASQGVVVRKGEEATYTDIAAFAGKTVGAQQGSTMADTLTDAFTASTPRILGDNPTLLMELRASKIDGLIVEGPVGESMIKKFDDIAMAPFEIPVEEGGVAVVIPKDNQKLIDAINATIKRLIDAGQIDVFYSAARDLYDQQPQ